MAQAATCSHGQPLAQAAVQPLAATCSHLQLRAATCSQWPKQPRAATGSHLPKQPCSHLQPLAATCSHLQLRAATCSYSQPLAATCNHLPLQPVAATCSRAHNEISASASSGRLRSSLRVLLYVDLVNLTNIEHDDFGKEA